MNEELKRITSRKVMRHYYKGKGYSTLFSVCRVIAKDEFKDLVYGPNREFAVDLAMSDDPPCPRFIEPESEAFYNYAYRHKMSSLVAKHFPHDESCLRPYYCSVDPTYPSCKIKVDAWILNRTRELMKEYRAC